MRFAAIDAKSRQSKLTGGYCDEALWCQSVCHGPLVCPCRHWPASRQWHKTRLKSSVKGIAMAWDAHTRTTIATPAPFISLPPAPRDWGNIEVTDEVPRKLGRLQNQPPQADTTRCDVLAMSSPPPPSILFTQLYLICRPETNLSWSFWSTFLEIFQFVRKSFAFMGLSSDGPSAPDV